MNLPTCNESYADKEYWDSRYVAEVEYDWFARYDAFRCNVVKTIKKSDRILQLGCGNSSLSVDMYHDGFHNIVNIDYSPVVISNMSARYSDLVDMKWLVMDARDMSSFEPSSFDVVLEKGTLDALLVGEKDPWRVSYDAEVTVELILTQISRLLKPNGGRFVSVTFAQPHFRVPLYLLRSNYDWDVSVETFGEGFHYFYYTMTRGQKPSLQHVQLRENYERRKTGNELLNSATCISNSDDEDFLLGAFCIDTDS
jgi:SAM-dependent methyltransferase